MKLTDDTMTILKNFSTINSSILIREGNVLRTMQAKKRLLAQKTVDNVFEKEVGIADLPKFLATTTLFNETPNITFADDVITLSDNGRRVLYKTAHPEVLAVPPDKKMGIPSRDVHLTLTWDVLSNLMKACSILGRSHIGFVSKGDGKVSMVSCDPKLGGSVFEETELDSDCPLNVNFEMYMDVSDMKMLPGDYDVVLAKRGIGEFARQGDDLVYWIIVDKEHLKYEEV